jgi:dCMP deaminase
MKWDEWFFEMAKMAAKKSKDRSTQVGCVIVGSDNEIRSVGYNGFARGTNDSREDWHERPLKYKVTAHAELNAVCNASRIGARLKGCTAYVTLPPCSSCALAMTQAGIKLVKFLIPIDNENNIEDRWKEDFRIALDIFTEAKIEYDGFTGVWREWDGNDQNPEWAAHWIDRIKEE